MTLPFTIDQFADVFRAYNESIWPAQWILNALALVSLAAAFAGRRRASQIASLVLAVLWVWTGLVYHARFFRVINPAAIVFAAAFVLQGLMIGWFGVVKEAVRFAARRNAATAVGSLLITYALVVYPLIGRAIGHRYPAAPTFGVPCPTTIFTLGLFLLAAPALPRMLLIIPVAWAVVGLSAVLQLGMWEDWGLPVAAIAVLVFSIRRDFRHGTWRRPAGLLELRSTTTPVSEAAPRSRASSGRARSSPRPSRRTSPAS